VITYLVFLENNFTAYFRSVSPRCSLSADPIITRFYCKENTPKVLSEICVGVEKNKLLKPFSDILTIAYQRVINGLRRLHVYSRNRKSENLMYLVKFSLMAWWWDSETAVRRRKWM